MWDPCGTIDGKRGSSGEPEPKKVKECLGLRKEWLGDLDSNQGCRSQNPEFYR